MPSRDLARLESGDYRAALLMLAMQSGHPDEAADIFRALSRKGEGTWRAFVDEWEPQVRQGSAGVYDHQLVGDMGEATAVGWRELHQAMVRQCDRVPEDDLQTFLRLWPAVARFGFATGRAVTKRQQ